MADGFPARTLEIDYHVRLDPLHRPPAAGGGSSASSRVAVREQYGHARLRAAVGEVFAALSRLPDDQQVILFVQDKAFLRDVRRALANPAWLQTLGDQEHVETHGTKPA